MPFTVVHVYTINICTLEINSQISNRSHKAHITFLLKSDQTRRCHFFNIIIEYRSNNLHYLPQITTFAQKEKNTHETIQNGNYSSIIWKLDANNFASKNNALPVEHYLSYWIFTDFIFPRWLAVACVSSVQIYRRRYIYYS